MNAEVMLIEVVYLFNLTCERGVPYVPPGNFACFRFEAFFCSVIRIFGDLIMVFSFRLNNHDMRVKYLLHFITSTFSSTNPNISLVVNS